MGLAVNRIHQGDCVKKLQQIEPGSVDLAFADPPFNIGYEYDVYDDQRSTHEYLDWSRKWIGGVFQALKSRGTFWLAIGDEFAAELKLIAQEAGFISRSWVIWYYTFGVNCKRGFSRSHTHLFHFVKNPRVFTFNQDNPAVRVPSARQLVYADARANPKGRLPDNTWILRPQDVPAGFPADHDTWYFPRIARTFKEREGFHGCQMPEQLLGRIVRICSNSNEVVLDPFAGSGTTLAVARKLGRQWMGLELSKDYVKQITRRLESTRVGDPLDGAAEPSKSAPSTSNGKTRGALRSAAGSKKPKSQRAQKVREEMELGVVAAYRRTHQGLSTDYLLANPEVNAGFVNRCKELGIAGDAVVWNQSLLRMRKQKKLPKLTEQRFRKTFSEMDDYSFASEVALLQLTASNGLSLDDILCNPELAAQFDHIAERFAPGHTPLEYRWAAPALRKRAIRFKRAAGEFVQWLDRSKGLPKARPIDKLSASKDEVPGVYVLIGRGHRNLYVGETLNLARRINHIGSIEAWMELEPVSVRLFTENEHRLLGLKSVLIKRINPALNSPLLAPEVETAT